MSPIFLGFSRQLDQQLDGYLYCVNKNYAKPRIPGKKSAVITIKNNQTGSKIFTTKPQAAPLLFTETLIFNKPSK